MKRKKIDIEEMRTKLLAIKNQAEGMNEDSFDKTKAFKFVYNSVLNLIDDLDFLADKEDLFDDDLFEEEENDAQILVEDNYDDLLDENDV